MKLCTACGAGFDAVDWTCSNCRHAPATRDGVTILAPEAIDTADGFDPASFGHLADLEDRSFWFRARNRLLIWAISQHFPDARSMLEIGCGTGYVMQGVRRAMPQIELTGAELYPQGLTKARERVPGADFVQLDATRIPYDGHFDIVGAFDVLEHIDDDRAVVEGMRQAVVPGGGLIITVPQHPWLWSPADDFARHRRRYKRGELRRLVTGAGFEVLTLTSFVSALLPAMVASRVRDRGRPDRSYDPVAEHRSAERVGAALEAVLNAEGAAIRHGVRFPVGGSLLLVARRT